MFCLEVLNIFLVVVKMVEFILFVKMVGFVGGMYMGVFLRVVKLFDIVVVVLGEICWLILVIFYYFF